MLLVVGLGPPPVRWPHQLPPLITARSFTAWHIGRGQRVPRRARVEWQIEGAVRHRLDAGPESALNGRRCGGLQHGRIEGEPDSALRVRRARGSRGSARSRIRLRIWDEGAAGSSSLAQRRIQIWHLLCQLREEGEDQRLPPVPRERESGREDRRWRGGRGRRRASGGGLGGCGRRGGAPQERGGGAFHSSSTVTETSNQRRERSLYFGTK